LKPPAAATLAVAALAILATLLFAASAPAAPMDAGLTVSMDHSLTLTGESAALTVTGDTIADMAADTTIEVSVAGPATMPQIKQGNPSLAKVGGFTITLGSLSATGRPKPSELHLPIPPTSLPLGPGAYQVTVSLRAGTAELGRGTTWMGRVPARTTPLDLAFVWRAELGIHRDAAGRFIDTTLDAACAPAAAGSGEGAGSDGSGDGAASAAPAGGLVSLAGLSTRFPTWQFSLGVEPVLLTQLRDMADGFTRADGSEKGATVKAGDPAATNAKAVLSALKKTAANSSVEIAAGSYADADLGLLGTQDWRDAFEQLQLGKQEVTETLELGLAPSGAVAPGLDMSGDGVGGYGQASLDHALVDAAVAQGLNEPVPAGTAAVRVHDDANDRVTLVLADSDLRSLMAPPWDASTLFAGIAAVLASGDRDALVLTTAPEFTLPPQAYLDAIGTELGKDAFLRTQTMAGLLRAHPPDTRPLLLTRDATPPTGYISQTIFSAIQTAHAAVDDLAAGADITSVSLEQARRSLYIAESRWWSRKGTSPAEASAGLAYATQAGTIARAALGKIRLTGVKSELIMGHDGSVTFTAVNDGDSVMNVELHVTGDGLTFPQGEMVKVRLEKGGNDIPVPVTGRGASRRLTGRLALGATDLGEQTATLRFLTVLDILPWAILAALVIVLAILLVLLLRKRKKGLRTRGRRGRQDSPRSHAAE
jgi:hypothetical protein